MNLEVPYHLENFIGGNLIGPLSGNFIDNVNPATGQVYGQIPDSHKKDVDAAVIAAKKIFPVWSTTPVEERFKTLNRIAELIDENLEELALAETNDNGKPLWLSKKVDIPRASANFRFFATGIMHFATESHNMKTKRLITPFVSRLELSVVFHPGTCRCIYLPGKLPRHSLRGIV
ncbi:MAG TPA: aldehyde dehydrogenase family protein [Chitinophagaceae bacterium]|nr:aldehyde dehydrogenase family protein [Chitinophagaceae bacterium]